MYLGWSLKGRSSCPIFQPRLYHRATQLQLLEGFTKSLRNVLFTTHLSQYPLREKEGHVCKAGNTHISITIVTGHIFGNMPPLDPPRDVMRFFQKGNPFSYRSELGILALPLIV